MEITIKQTKKPFQFTAHNQDEAVINVAGVDLQKDNPQGFRPTELLLVAVGSCMSIDVVQILQKQKQQISDYQVKVTGTRVDEIPRTFKHILIELHLKGEIEEAKLQRAIQLSVEKYCSVHKMLEQAAQIECKYYLNDEG